MIGEEKYYGAISADSPFFFENYQKLQDEEQTGWHAESQIPPSWSLFIQSLGRTQARMSADYE